MPEEHHPQRPREILRPRIAGEHSRVSNFELFFDLVFVFAITQLSHSLAGHLSLEGALQTLVLLLAVWWAWMYTAWATNWLNPEHVSVRLLLIAVMLGGLIMSAAIPQAFDGRGLAFAVTYVAIQVGRTVFLAWATRADALRRLTFLRIAAWFAVSSILWFAGVAAEGELRLVIWSAALAFEYLGPSAGYWLPVLGRSMASEWTIEGAHLAERCGLFIIIALGESLLITGATFSGLSWSSAVVAAMLASFGAAVAMWWIYFDVTAELGAERIAHAENPGVLGRSAYTYIHLPIVAGIILTAVGDEAVLAHPTGETAGRVALVILGGPALFLLGHWLFKKAVFGRFVIPHVAGMLALGAALGLYGVLTPAALSVVATAILAAVAVWIWMLERDELAAEAAAHG